MVFFNRLLEILMLTILDTRLTLSYQYYHNDGPIRLYSTTPMRWLKNTRSYETNPYIYYRQPEPGFTYSRSSVLETVGKITDTLGALNTIGEYIVNVTRDSKNISNIPKDVPNAIYTLSKNVLGRNITDTIAPFVGETQQIRRDVQETTPATYLYPTTTENNLQSCTTPDGAQGTCDDLSNCPQLLLNLQDLRQSLCFKSLFVPGVCCRKNAAIDSETPQSSTRKPPVFLESSTQPTTTTITYPPPPTTKPAQIYYNHLPTTTQFPELFTLGSNPEGNEDCGQQEDEQFRVVGGEEAPPERWPWVAAIFLHGNRKVEFWCGGSLVSRKHVLTAAHCTKDANDKPFAPYQLSVRLGDVDLKRTDEPSNPATYRVAQIRRHEKYNRVGYYNDIAILIVDRTVQRSKYVIPLCLPSESLRYETFEGRKSTVVGWGSTYYNGKESSVQRQAVIPIWKNDDCNQAYYQPITSHFICAGYAEGGIDACQGDSGGPLMLFWDTKWLQVGIVSFGNKCGEPGYPGVYTRITEYLFWIKDNIKNVRPCQLSVRLGDIDLKKTDECSNPATYRVAQIRTHEKYNRVGYYNDIATLIVDRTVQRSKYVIPLCLPSEYLRYETFEGRKSTVVGWGSTYYNGKESSVQRQAVIPIWKNDDCNQAYYQPITSHFICAGYAEGGIDACQGDSGGPLMLFWDTKWLQVGIVSFGNKCGEPGYPGVYTRITEYLFWIKDNIKN